MRCRNRWPLHMEREECKHEHANDGNMTTNISASYTHNDLQIGGRERRQSSGIQSKCSASRTVIFR